jgi:threonine synthase
MWKAFHELEQLGWINGNKPRMVSVQTAGCAPIVKAFQERKTSSEYWEHATTCASGLRVPKAFADTMILNALYESKGTAIAITEEELLNDMFHAAHVEGLFLCPEGAAAVSAARRLAREGYIAPSETVVIFNTGTGYKYTELFLSLK